MSLILEALRKLEKDRLAPDPGVVVVGAQPWPAPRRVPKVMALVLCALALVTFGFWLGTRPHQTVPPAPASSSVPPAPALAETAGEALPAADIPEIRRPAPERQTRSNETRPAPPSGTAAASPKGGATEAPASAEPTAGEPDGGASFVTPKAGDAQGALPRLSAIGRREERAIAIINDRVMREGDSIDGVTVIRIGEMSVDVEIAGRRHTLSF